MTDDDRSKLARSEARTSSPQEEGIPQRGNQAAYDIRALGEELRALFAEERKAIAALDHARLTYIASLKHELVERLTAARAAAPTAIEPEVRALFATIRAEAHATAMLAHAANEAVRALLGIERSGYDRHARPTHAATLRLLAAY